MSDFRCDHVPPCAALPGCQERQRDAGRPAKCEWCGRKRPLGKFWQPVARRYIWICRECSGSESQAASPVTLSGHQERQRGDIRRALAARAAMLRNRRGRARAREVLPGMMRRAQR